MARLFLIIGSASGLLTVILGAFGAHALQDQLTTQQLSWWYKAVNYQGLHSLALLATGLFALVVPTNPLKWAGWSFIGGILLFSGSLYLLAMSGIRALAMLTPLGGLGLIVGWGCLLWAAWRLP